MNLEQTANLEQNPEHGEVLAIIGILGGLFQVFQVFQVGTHTLASICTCAGKETYMFLEPERISTWNTWNTWNTGTKNPHRH